jgi:hypothetical protein
VMNVGFILNLCVSVPRWPRLPEFLSSGFKVRAACALLRPCPAPECLHFLRAIRLRLSQLLTGELGQAYARV